MKVFLLVVGGLFVTVAFLWPAVKIMGHGKLFKKKGMHILVGVLMLLGGVGLVGITAWLVGLAANWSGATVTIGCIAFLALIGVGAGLFVGILGDHKIDRPEQWGLFSLAALITAVVMTSGPTFAFFSEQFTSNTDTLKAKVEQAQRTGQ